MLGKRGSTWCRVRVWSKDEQRVPKSEAMRMPAVQTIFGTLHRTPHIVNPERYIVANLQVDSFFVFTLRPVHFGFFEQEITLGQTLQLEY